MSGENKFVPGKRLYLNAARDKLVKEGHADAASLWCSEYHMVSRADYDRLMPKKKATEKAEKKPAKKAKKKN